ncbi:restriction endonuclease subunit S [Brucella pseudintermedia]|uniref:restriction endonuclease subunit S n=1 Tax=Brucella pseudintermedia TaxID=370111 RepID=UPI0030F36EF6
MSDLTALDSLLTKLPSGWSSPAIANVARLINGRGFKPHEWVTDGLPIIRIQNLNGSTDFNYYSGSYNPKIEVNTGDLLFAWSGSRGTSFGPHFWSGPKGVLNYHTWRVKVDESAISPDFFYHALRFLTRIIEDRAHGASALVHVQKWEMEKFGFPCPNDRAEQQAIAAALSDADGVVAGLERVIAKKRLIKQGAMQDLLSARRRLPGFSGEWEAATLSELADIRSGGTPSTSDATLWDGDIAWVTPTDITALDGQKFLSGTTRTISRAGLRQSSAELLPEGTIVMTSRATIGECAISAIPLTTNQGFKNFIPKDRADRDFLYYLLMSQKKGFIELCSGSTFLEIGKTQLTGYTVRVPETKKEQEAIAAVLSDMDAEIQTLESRLAKARAVKEGMMQNLLTGRVRLV